MATMNDLNIAAVASPGQTVFLEITIPISDEQAIRLRESADITVERNGIHIVFLPQGVTVAKISSEETE